LSEIAKQIERGLPMDPSRHQFLGQHPVTACLIQHYCQLFPQSQPTSKAYRKSIQFWSNRQVKDQHWWLPLSAPLYPSSILPTNIAINHPQKIGTANKAGGGLLPTSCETCPDPCVKSHRRSLHSRISFRCTFPIVLVCLY